jgi:hypothetical protein
VVSEFQRTQDDLDAAFRAHRIWASLAPKAEKVAGSIMGWSLFVAFVGVVFAAIYFWLDGPARWSINPLSFIISSFAWPILMAAAGVHAWTQRSRQSAKPPGIVDFPASQQRGLRKPPGRKALIGWAVAFAMILLLFMLEWRRPDARSIAPSFVPRG